MALTGLQIYKMLPRTNCKECGQATCLAFAMQLAAGKASLDLCPHVSQEAREALSSASEPPIALVKIGTGEHAVELGNETVLFRHDKRFVHPTAIAVTVSDLLDKEQIARRVEEINGLFFERVGQVEGVNLVAVKQDGDRDRFVAAVRVAGEKSALPLMLISEDAGALAGALEIAGDGRPLICGATRANREAVVELARKYDCPLVVRSDNLDDLAGLVDETVKAGHKQLILDTGARSVERVLADQTLVRRLAVNKRFRLFGYPTVAFACSGDAVQDMLDAAVYIGKYAAVVVVDSAERADILPLITWRLNIYTDPQKPIAVEAKVYEVGKPGPDSPVFLTTNFSLTYFCVAGDIEGARTSAYILPVDTEGTSVLTAWAAGKLAPEKIAEFIEESGIAERVRHRKLIIPGGLAVMSGKLQEATGWEILVGPRESSSINAFLKEHWS